MEVPKNKVQIIKSMNICDVFPVATFIFKTTLLMISSTNHNIVGTVNVRPALALTKSMVTYNVACKLYTISKYELQKSYCGIINLFLKLTKKYGTRETFLLSKRGRCHKKMRDD